MRNATMDAIDEAVFHYQGPGEKASCSSSKNHFAASAMCWGDISFEDCRNCLWNAQYRLVEHYCRSRSAGLLILTNCSLSRIHVQTTMNTTTSSFIILIIILLFNTLENDVVRCDDPNVTYVLSLCNEFTADDTGLNSRVLEAIVMEAIDDAVYYYQGPGEKATCTEIPFDSDIYPSSHLPCVGETYLSRIAGTVCGMLSIAWLITFAHRESEVGSYLPIVS
ncbi:hypothetical protein LINPERPRIM_LOCUS19855 [Linum perenne]